MVDVIHTASLGNTLVMEVNGDPNSSVTAPKGSKAYDSTNGEEYRNTDGGTNWLKIRSAPATATGISYPVDLDADPIAPSPVTVKSGEVLAFEMPTGATRSVVADFELPSEIDLTKNPKLRVNFVVTTAGSGVGDVRLVLNVRYLTVGELTTKANDETLVVLKTVVNTEDEVQEVEFTLNASLISVGDRLNFALDRTGGHVDDTFDGDVGIVEIATMDHGI